MTLLALAIPTYNRSDILIPHLKEMCDTLNELEVDVYIYDDSSDSYTENSIKSGELAIKNLYYKRNIPGNGHDINLRTALKETNAEYIWLLGDSFKIDLTALRKIHEFIYNNSEFDLISVNTNNERVGIVEPKCFNTALEVYEKLGWHLTLTGTTIYKKKAINFDLNIIENYKNFPQISIIFETLHYNNSQLYWWGNSPVLIPNNSKKSYWMNSIFQTFIDDLRITLKNLPLKLSDKQIDFFIKDHAIRSGICSFKNFISLRGKNYFNQNVLKQYQNDFKKYSNTPILVLKIIAVIPSSLINFMIGFLKH